MEAPQAIEQRLAAHVLSTVYGSLPSAAVEATKEHILHTTATVLAGSAAPGAGEMVATLQDVGGREESTILGCGVRVPAMHAAMANSLMGHAQDFDNNDDRIAYKTSVCAVPTGIAVAERVGRVSGQDLIVATCIGIDLGIRLGLAVQPYPAHSQSPELGPFAAAATAGKLIGLDADQIWDALGLALCGVATVGVSTSGLTYSKRFEAGAASRNGIFAALLAARGFRARQPVVIGAGNFFRSVWKTEADVGKILNGLGESFEVVNVGPKPYPSCRYTHAPVDGALALMAAHKIAVDDIGQVRVTVGRRDFDVVFGGEQGIARKQTPQSIVDAQFSIPYTVATAIRRGRLFLDDFSQDAIKRPEILDISRKVVPVVREEFDVWNEDVRPCQVEIVTRRGEIFARRVDHAKGNPRNPVPREEIRANFVACAQRTPKPIREADILRARDLIENLEDVKDASEIPALLSGAA